jgi:hypothetical protein
MPKYLPVFLPELLPMFLLIFLSFVPTRFPALFLPLMPDVFFSCPFFLPVAISSQTCRVNNFLFFATYFRYGVFFFFGFFLGGFGSG